MRARGGLRVAGDLCCRLCFSDAHRCAAKRALLLLAIVRHDSCRRDDGNTSATALTRRGALPIVNDGTLMSYDCFADEIAIDFPSVEPAVERMRDAFFGEPADHDVLRFDLHVSRREAWDGLVVPIDVPVQGLCRPCGGRGEIWTEPCSGCRGTGASLLRRSVRVTLPAGVADGARFHFRVSLPGAEPVRVEVRVAITNAVTNRAIE